jgi:hexokinase
VGKAAQEDPAIAQYLSRKENLYTVTVDANASVARVWQVKVEPGRQTTVKEVFSAPMNPTWLSPFKRSL